MKNIPLRIAAALSGFEFSVVRNYDSISRRKVAVFAICMCLPTSIWIISGFFLVTRMLEGSTGTGIWVGLALGTLVFWLERLIILANGGRLLFALRICIALSSAILGSVIFKTLVFQQDIDEALAARREQMAKAIKNKITKSYENEIKQDSLHIVDYYAKWQEYANKAALEATGGYTKHVGDGRLTRHFTDQRNYFKQLMDDEQAKLDKINDAIQAEVSAKSNYAKTHEEGLLLKIRVFASIIEHSKVAMGMFILLFIPLMCIELITLAVKTGSPVSNYEFDETLLAHEVRIRASGSKNSAGQVSERFLTA